VKKNTFSQLKQSFLNISWSLGLPLFIGVVLSISTLSGLISTGMEQFPQYILSISFGIVFVSVFIPWREMTKHSWKEYLLMITSALTFLALFSMPIESNYTNNLFIVFLGGIVCSFAGFFPGISISFGMLLLGIYFPIYEAIHLITSRQGDTSHIILLATFLIGLAAGVLACVRFFPWLFKRYKNTLLAGITGLIVASLYATWPFIKVVPGGDTENFEKLLPWQIEGNALLLQLFMIVTTIVLIFLIQRYAALKGASATSFNFESIDSKSTQK
jgi:putative membrane protein